MIELNTGIDWFIKLSCGAELIHLFMPARCVFTLSDSGAIVKKRVTVENQKFIKPRCSHAYITHACALLLRTEIDVKCDVL